MALLTCADTGKLQHRLRQLNRARGNKRGSTDFRDVIKLVFMVYVKNNIMHGIHDTYIVKTMPHKAWIRSDKYVKSDCLPNLVNSVVHTVFYLKFFEHPSFGQVAHEIYPSEWKVHSSEISITIMYCWYMFLMAVAIDLTYVTILI